METALTETKQQTPLLGLLSKYKKTIEDSLPQHLRPERMMKVIVAAINRTPDLLRCEPMTVINSIVHLSQLGLEPRPGEAYLIPFKRNLKDSDGQWRVKYECTPVIDYRGKAKLARQSGLVEDIVPDVVYSRDTFKFEITQDGLMFEHKPLKLREVNGELVDVGPQERGKMVGAYAIAFIKDAKPHAVFMTRSEIRAIREKAKAKDGGPWAEKEDGTPVNENDWNEQAKKTVVHRLCKMIPQSIELSIANELEDKVDAGQPLDNLLGDVIEAEIIHESPASLKDRVRQRTAPAAETEPEPEHKTRTRKAKPEPEPGAEGPTSAPVATQAAATDGPEPLTPQNFTEQELAALEYTLKQLSDWKAIAPAVRTRLQLEELLLRWVEGRALFLSWVRDKCREYSVPILKALETE